MAINRNLGNEAMAKVPVMSDLLGLLNQQGHHEEFDAIKIGQYPDPAGSKPFWSDPDSNKNVIKQKLNLTN